MDDDLTPQDLADLEEFSQANTDYGGVFDLPDDTLALIDETYQAERVADRLEAVGGDWYVYKPFRANWPLTQGYHQPNHPALDYGMATGTSLFNPFPGKARVVGVGPISNGYAYWISLYFPGYDYTSVFGHLRSHNWSPYRVGDWVDPVKVCAYSDNTGYSTGPHLHYEIRKRPFGGYADCINFTSRLRALPSTPPEPGPGPDPTPGQLLLCKVRLKWKKTKALSVRSAPDVNAPVIGHLTDGQQVKCRALPRVGNDVWADMVEPFPNGYAIGIRYKVARTEVYLKKLAVIPE